MIITTAKRPFHGRAGAALRLTPLALAALLVSNGAWAQWKVTPGIDLRETYSDNVNNQTDGLAQASWVSEAAPNITIVGNGPRLKMNVNAEWRTFAYAKDDIPNVRNSERHYTAGAQFMAVDELLYVDAAANGQRQAVSPYGPLSTNSFSSINDTNINTWSVSPYLRHRFGSTATATVRFTRDAVTGGSGVGFANSTANTRSAQVLSGTNFAVISWNLNYTHQDLEAQNAAGTSSENSLAGVQWHVLPHLSLTATAGYDKYEYAVINQVTEGKSWSGGFIWQPSTHTHLEASFGRRYFGNTGSLLANYRTRHSVWSLTYNDSVTTTRQQFLVPSSLDTAASLDALFASAYPDPVVRQQVIQVYMASAGLPTNLPTSVNYLSNRYLRLKRLQGEIALRGARSDLLLSVFSDQTTALSLQQEDNSLLGSQFGSLNDNTRQRGASATADYRLDGRTTANAGFYLTHVQSVQTGITNNYRSASVGLTRRLGAKLSGSLDLRHSNGRAGTFDTSNYHENAIVATLSAKF
jgi:uncharacterized protein (PEP-CTERM system associated)